MHVYRIAQVVCSTSKSQDGVSQICGGGRRKNFFEKSCKTLLFNSTLLYIASVRHFLILKLYDGFLLTAHSVLKCVF